jgi:hypothetical protein
LYPDSGELSIPCPNWRRLRAGDQAAWDTLVGRYTGLVWPSPGPHLVHPSRCKAIASARLKNDKVDAATLAQLLRADLLPEAWIAPRRPGICGRCRAIGPAWSG